MRTVIVVLVVLGGLLGLATAAHAKGPTAAVVEGPGLTEPVRIESYEATDRLPSIDTMMRRTGAEVMFGSGVQLDAATPAGELGTRFTVTYLAGQDVVLTQRVYPFAAGGPVTYTPPGQRSIFVDAELSSGWFRAPPELTSGLLLLGAADVGPQPAADTPQAAADTPRADAAADPAAAPVALATAPSAADGGLATGWWLGGALLAAAVLALAGLAVSRRTGVGARR